MYIVALQRVQKPTNLEVRRLNAVVRKMQKEPQKLIFQAMKCLSQIDIHTDSGYRRLDSAEDIKGYGMRGLCLFRRGKRFQQDRGNATAERDLAKLSDDNVVHLLDSICRSHRLTIRSSYGAEMIAASHGMDDAFPTMVTLVELKHGVLKPEQLKRYREQGKLPLTTSLQVIDQSRSQNAS